MTSARTLTTITLTIIIAATATTANINAGIIRDRQRTPIKNTLTAAKHAAQKITNTTAAAAKNLTQKVKQITPIIKNIPPRQTQTQTQTIQITQKQPTKISWTLLPENNNNTTTTTTQAQIRPYTLNY